MLQGGRRSRDAAVGVGRDSRRLLRAEAGGHQQHWQTKEVAGSLLPRGRTVQRYNCTLRPESMLEGGETDDVTDRWTDIST